MMLDSVRMNHSDFVKPQELGWYASIALINILEENFDLHTFSSFFV